MDVKGLKAYCARFPGATSKEYGPPSNVLVFAVGGKQFAYFKLSNPEMWRFSIRVTSERFLELTGVPGIKPARYMGRFHWVTIVDVRSVPERYLKELVAWSYDRALGSLSKAKRAELVSG
jgi:predicted DNA-binding protein (MmcQ/YjbR family)